MKKTKKTIREGTPKYAFHGYQECWMSWDGYMTINFRGHCVNNEDIGYQEYHRQHMTEYCIR